MNERIYDTILIGNSPSIYMCGIYLKTSNLDICILKHSSVSFSGYETVPGVLNVKSCDDFIKLLEDQSVFLKINVLTKTIVDVSHEQYFKIECKDGVMYSRTLVVDNKDFEIDVEGCFNAVKNVLYNEAIVLSAQGCKTSFSVREFLSKLK